MATIPENREFQVQTLAETTFITIKLFTDLRFLLTSN